MKTRLSQKVFSAVLVVLMLSVLVLPSSAADLSGNLITWWNFEGATLEECLSDKAPAGKANDVITIEGDAVKVADGIAFVPTTAGNILHAAKTEDTLDFNNKTIYFRLRLDGMANQSADFVEIPGTLRMFVDMNSMIDHTFTGRALLEARLKKE